MLRARSASFDVFISYAHDASESEARALRAALEAQRIRAFVSTHDIPSGARFPDALAEAIGSTRLVVLLLSQAAVRSSFVQRELTLAITRHNLPVLPVLLEPVEMDPGIGLLISDAQQLDVSDAVGDAQLAQIVTAVVDQLGTLADKAGHQAAQDASDSLRIALLYKRKAQPDEALLAFLEQGLSARGHTCFIDRHMRIGVEWARQIAEEIRAADAVIPLVSEASIGSEMLAYEVQVARDAARERGGKPYLFPIRIGIEGALPGELGTLLNPLQYALWRDEADNERLLAELSTAVLQPPRPALTPIEDLEPVGGAMPLDSKFYVERPVDEALLAGIERRDSILLIKGARQIGKTSLLARGLREARLAGNRVVLTDLQKLTQEQFADLERFYLALGQFIADQLDLDTDPEDNWRPNRSPNLNFERFVRRQVLAATDAPLFWAIDETDRLFSTAFGTEVFALIRSWHNDRALDPEGPWSRLTLAIAYATEAYLFIDDPNQSPFNVGTRLTLDDFTLEQIADLNRRYGGPLAEGQQLNRFHALVDGQPYLVRRGLDLMARERIDIDELEARADLDSGPFGDHLRRILVLLARDPELCEQVRGFLRKPFALTPEHFHRLTSAGLMAGRTRDQARFRCGIYERYLGRQLA